MTFSHPCLDKYSSFRVWFTKNHILSSLSWWAGVRLVWGREWLLLTNQAVTGCRQSGRLKTPPPPLLVVAMSKTSQVLARLMRPQKNQQQHLNRINQFQQVRHLFVATLCTRSTRAPVEEGSRRTGWDDGANACRCFRGKLGRFSQRQLLMPARSTDARLRDNFRVFKMSIFVAFRFHWRLVFQFYQEGNLA